MEKNIPFKLNIINHESDREILEWLAYHLEEWGIESDYLVETVTGLTESESKDGMLRWVKRSIEFANGILFFIGPAAMKGRFARRMEEAFQIVSKSGKPVLIIMYAGAAVPQYLRTYEYFLAKEEDRSGMIGYIVRAVKNTSQRKENEPERSNGGPGYFLLKMNPATWFPESLNVGAPTFFSTYYLNSKRPEYELLLQVRPGDQVLGFAAGEYQSIACIMEVVNAVGPDTAQGEVFIMKVKELFQPYLPLRQIESFIPEVVPYLTTDSRPPRLFFSIDETAYSSILERLNSPVVAPAQAYQPFYLTEGDHENTQDQLDFENDIDSFASVIALKKVVPPLAIGLFGNWGSGKSFFMEKLYDRINTICGKEEEYIETVVQVKFNSWHYSDTNLWASLITEIFDSLNKYAKQGKQEPEIEKLEKTLQSVSLEKEAINEKKKELENSVRKLETVQAQKRERLEDLSGIKLVKLILTDEKIKKDLSELNNENIESIVADGKKIDQYITELKDTRNKRKFFFSELFSLRGWRWKLALAVAIAVAAVAFFIPGLLPSQWGKITRQIAGAVSLISVLGAKIISAISPYRKALSEALKRLQSLKQTIESRPEDVPAELAEQKQELDQLQSSLEKIDQRIKSTEADIADIRSGRRLSRFIDERAKDQGYSSALGVISQIRKDFVTLDSLLRQQHQAGEKEKNELFNPENVQLKIDRIVLYIDDLDRCNGEVVVKVLEAIHLLLAFKLFVVVVGVDPRWLNNALSEKYKNLFGQREEKKTNKNDGALDPPTEEEALLSGVATSYDYLEKIFQIPFALKPITKTGREKLVQYLIREEMQTGHTHYVDAEEKAEATDHVDAALIKQEDQQPSSDIKKETDPGVQKQTSPEKKDETKKKSREQLKFSRDELAYMQKISPLFGQTPRTINRYINIYRIIKAHGSLQSARGFSKSDFMPVMLLLGIVVGHSVQAEKFITAVKDAAGNTVFEKFITDNNPGGQLMKAVRPLLEEVKNMPMDDFKRNIELISRFSFRTLLK